MIARCFAAQAMLGVAYDAYPMSRAHSHNQGLEIESWVRLLA